MEILRSPRYNRGSLRMTGAERHISFDKLRMSGGLEGLLGDDRKNLQRQCQIQIKLCCLHYLLEGD